LNREEFILATKATGVSMPALIVKHILYYEARGLIVLQYINFFFFTIMLEIFLGFFGKGAGELSIGRLIGKDKILYGIDWQYLPTDQYKLILVFPLLFVLILCLVTRWLAKRVMLLTEN
jgi:ABC-type dipeptide/oligopeptide/nickel transport system permease subunit